MQSYSHSGLVAQDDQIWRESRVAGQSASCYLTRGALVQRTRREQGTHRGKGGNRSQGGVGDRDPLVAATLIQVRRARDDRRNSRNEPNATAVSPSNIEGGTELRQ